MSRPVLQVSDLQVRFPTPLGMTSAVDHVGFELQAGETLGIVGESGSGKTMTALATMGLIPRSGVVESGSIVLNGRELIGAPNRVLRSVRGSEVGMIFQEPMTSLHPTLTVGFQIGEAITAHDHDISKKELDERVVSLLDRVGIPEARRRAGEYPHTWSGGMRQRAMIAMAVANDPDVLIADEPTTALDVTIQAQVLEVLREMRSETGAALIVISHDLGVIAEMADRIAVMYAGKIIEIGSTEEIFSSPLHPYTAGLMASIPRLDGEVGFLPSIPGRPPDITQLPCGCSFHPRCGLAESLCASVVPALEVRGSHAAACFFSEKVAVPAPAESHPVNIESASRQDQPLLEVEGLEVHYEAPSGMFRRRRSPTKAVDGISFSLAQGETLGLVGESGCGKTTTARALLRLVKPTSGTVRFKGRDMAELQGAELRRVRRDIQAVFQDPFGSLNPRMTVSRIIASPLEVHGRKSRSEIRDRVQELLDLVSLGPELLERHPAALSGGQRQRVGIARALALEPALLILDEPLSALDVSIQAQILNLLKRLQDRLGLSYLLIAHDLAAVRYLADRVAVMYLGKIVESGMRDEIYERPAHPYSRALLSAVPDPSPGVRRDRIVLSGDVPMAGAETVGCRFASRCYEVRDACLESEPALLGSGRTCACFFPLAAVAGGGQPS